MNLINCDLTSAFEDGGIGGIVVAIVWGLWNWYKRHANLGQQQQK